MLLPRSNPVKKKIRSPGLEYPLLIQRVRSAYLSSTTKNVLRLKWHNSLPSPEVSNCLVQLRRQSHRWQRQKTDCHLARWLLQQPSFVVEELSICTSWIKQSCQTWNTSGVSRSYDWYAFECPSWSFRLPLQRWHHQRYLLDQPAPWFSFALFSRIFRRTGSQPVINFGKTYPIYPGRFPRTIQHRQRYVELSRQLQWIHEHRPHPRTAKIQRTHQNSQILPQRSQIGHGG